MVDVARQIDEQRIEKEERQDERPDRGRAAGEPSADRRRAAHHAEEQQHRPGGQRKPLAVAEKVAEQDQPGDRRVDQARPVEERAARRIHAMLDEIEPALARQEVAHLHEPQKAVRVLLLEKMSG